MWCVYVYVSGSVLACTYMNGSQKLIPGVFPELIDLSTLTGQKASRILLSLSSVLGLQPLSALS